MKKNLFLMTLGLLPPLAVLSLVVWTLVLFLYLDLLVDRTYDKWEQSHKCHCEVEKDTHPL
jgi:hypothetical protein